MISVGAYITAVHIERAGFKTLVLVIRVDVLRAVAHLAVGGLSVWRVACGFQVGVRFRASLAGYALKLACGVVAVILYARHISNCNKTVAL